MGGSIPRIEKITQLLHELKFELERGFIEGDIDETITFEFVHPNSRSIPGGSVYARFQTRPSIHDGQTQKAGKPRLELVKK